MHHGVLLAPVGVEDVKTISKFACYYSLLASNPMKIAVVLSLATAFASAHAATPAIPTDQMPQFLQEKATLEMELASWKQSSAGQYAKEHGFLPSPSTKAMGSEAASQDEELRRLFLTKMRIEEVQATNPDAVFSTDTPFTLMTDDEFVAFLGVSYQRGADIFSAAAPIVDELSNSTVSPSTDKDWTTSGCVAGVKDQGQCGSCWAFAAIAALESAVCLAGQPLVPLSEQQVLDCDTASYGCQGGFPGDALDFIQRSGGVCSEDDYPYVSGDNGDSESCQKNSCTAEAVKIRKVVSVPATETGLLQAISGRPVAVGVAAGNPTWKQYKGGVVSSCSSTDLDHAVLAVGYGGEASSLPFFKIKNSWGTQWGEDGFIRLKRGAGTGSGGTCGVIGPKSVYPEL